MVITSVTPSLAYAATSARKASTSTNTGRVTSTVLTTLS